MKHILLPVLTIPLLLSLLPVASAQDWNQWRGANRDGYTPNSPPLVEALPEAGLKPLWQSEAFPSGFNGGWSSPVIAGGKVYLFVHHRDTPDDVKIPQKKFPWLPPEKRTMSDEEYQQYEVDRRNEDEEIGALYRFQESLFCFDAKTGETQWRSDQPTVYTRFLHSGTPTIIDGKAYVLGAPKTARCIDLKTQKTLWSTEVPGEFRDEYYMSSIAVIDGVAMFTAGRLFGLDAASGDILWSGDEEKTSGIHSSVVEWNNLAIANGGRRYTFCVEPKTGKELWRVESGANHSTPTLVGSDKMLTLGESRKSGLRCYQIGRDGAEKLWEYGGVADSGGSPVAAGGFAFVAGDRKVACVDLATGEEQWKEFLKLDKPRYTSVFAVGDQVFYPWGGLVAFRAAGTFDLLYQGMLNQDSVLATREAHRKALKLDEMDDREALKIFQDKVTKRGTLACTNAAMADGMVVLRTNERLVAFDLRR